jgi:thioredoxin 1
VEILDISESNFENEVLKAVLPVLVDFGAEWCGPCKMLDPIVDQLASQWDHKVKVVRVNVDQNPNLTIDFQVLGVPTLLMFKDGRPVERATGYQPKERLEKKFIGYLK